MKTTSKKIISTLLAVTLGLSLFAAMPVITSAVDTAALSTMIEGFDHGGNGKLSASASGDTVTVTGSVSNARNPMILETNGISVVWRASYSGYIRDADSSMISVTQGGSFEVADGYVANNGGGCAVRATKESGIKVSGGIVSAVEGNALRAEGQGTSITITGGFVFALGTDIIGDSNVIYMTDGTPNISANAVVCAWNALESETPTYNVGSSTGLVVSPSGAAVTWDEITVYYSFASTLEQFLRYANGGNKGLFFLRDIREVKIKPATTSYQVGFVSEGEEPYQYIDVTAGTTVPKPDPPSKAGFTFVGWYRYKDITYAYNFDIPLNRDRTLYARWDATGEPSLANFKDINLYYPGMFADVDENAWYGYNMEGAVASAYRYAMMSGNSATTFNTEGNITIAELVTVATRIHSFYMTGHQAEFTLVPGDKWYQGNVNYAIANEIISSDDFTDYDRMATRAEMAYIISRSMPSSEFMSQNLVTGLPDVNNDTQYHDAIFTLYRAGVLNGGDSKGRFNPDNNISRAEAAAIISRTVLPYTRKSGRLIIFEEFDRSYFDRAIS
ncbi:MAG: S-layer homology domain-containing protein [Oscillospiraceae bacterium]|nr:S-layer homology domain-containing protein [Oscillospiraceae bacterium]